MIIIGLSGKAGSGKSTVERFLVHKHSFEGVSLAKPMKEFCRDLFGFSFDQMYGSSSHRNEIDPRYGKSPREALQTLGTDWGRAFHEDVWINYALRKGLEVARRSPTMGLVIPDIRFQNELDAVRKAGGKVWRIVRPGAGLKGALAEHPSETELTDDMPYDRVINNADGELTDLEKLVARAIGGQG